MTERFRAQALEARVFEAGEADWALSRSRRPAKISATPLPFKIKRIKPDASSNRDQSYRPDFTNVPLELSENRRSR